LNSIKKLDKKEPKEKEKNIKKINVLSKPQHWRHHYKKEQNGHYIVSIVKSQKTIRSQFQRQRPKIVAFAKLFKSLSECQTF